MDEAQGAFDLARSAVSACLKEVELLLANHTEAL
jgi:hypothetical protein